MAKSEQWRQCAAHSCYEVSDRGQVRRRDTLRLLKPQLHDKGYLKVHLGRSMQFYVHALVATAFLGPRPLEHDVDHLDFDRANNAVVNLRWLLSLENAVRWAGRTSDRRNIWVDAEEIPEDHLPLSSEESDELRRERDTAGW